jgi:predicted enzyme related to lactoylglutathione lyase
MAGSRFFRYELRTTDVNKASEFYLDVLGMQFWASGVSVVPLPEQAVSRGAPAHWLGHVDKDDVESTADRILALGGQQLGPTLRGADGSVRAVLRDPFGAVLALSSKVAAPYRTPVAWHLHHSADYERSFALYAALFGWNETELWDLGPQRGCHQMFAWDESGRAVGAMTNIVSSEIHPQWLFFFPVDNIEHSLATVSARGGLALGRTQIPNGHIVVPCEDPQGAAFALYQVVHEDT